MIDAFFERHPDPPADRAAVLAEARAAAAHLREHGVVWCGTLLATSGRFALWWLRAADLASVRTALAGWEGSLWQGTVHGDADTAELTPEQSLALVGRRFDEPVTMESIQAIEYANRNRLADHRVRFLRSFFSADHRRMLCLYEAPDAESVRLAQQQAGMPMEIVWAVEYLHPGAASATGL
ncbi:MAG TPA: DUF4242 domain-containing protein [Pseudomonadales bacterium]